MISYIDSPPCISSSQPSYLNSRKGTRRDDFDLKSAHKLAGKGVGGSWKWGQKFFICLQTYEYKQLCLQTIMLTTIPVTYRM